jgi:anti-sigma B factor antagonist
MVNYNETPTLTLQQLQNGLVLTLEADHLKHAAVPLFKEALYAQLKKIEAAQPLILNFSQITYMDSFSLAVILSVYKFCRETGRHLALTHLNDQVTKLIQLTRLQTVLSAYSTDAEALNALAAL